MIYADKILKSNAIFDSVSDEPFAGGIAISGNRILAVCKGDDIDQYASDETEIFEFQDELIMPGLVDAHDHLWWGAVADSSHVVNLTASTSEEEAIEMIKKFAAEHPEEPRIRGFGWFPATWNDAPLPTKETLDKAVPDRPAYMNCADAHTAWLNIKALEEAGYRADMVMEAGSVGVGSDGEMNGLIFEPDALELAWNKFYDFPDEQIEEIMDNFMAGLAKQGVTSLAEMSADDYVPFFHHRYDIFKKMASEGKFTSRVHAFTKFMRMTDFTDCLKWKEEFNSPFFKVSGVKGFLDGVTSTYTGLTLEPYEDRPDTCGVGVPLDNQESLNASVVAANKAGLPVRIHCVSEGAVRMALDAFEESINVNGKHDLVNAIEHIEICDPADIPRFRELGVVASMQGEHLPMEQNEKLVRMGEARCRWEWPFKSLIEAGASMAFGTDFPVVYYNQWPGIYASIARRNYDGTIAGADNGEKLTLAQALKANTIGSAHVFSRDYEFGTLEEGKLADVLVCNTNPFTCPEEKIKDVKSILTIMDGKITYEA